MKEGFDKREKNNVTYADQLKEGEENERVYENSMCEDNDIIYENSI